MSTASPIDRLDVADFHRRMEALANRVGDMAGEMAVMSAMSAQRAADMKELKAEVKAMGDTFSRGQGAIWVLTAAAAAAAAVSGFWDKLKWAH